MIFQVGATLIPFPRSGFQDVKMFLQEMRRDDQRLVLDKDASRLPPAADLLAATQTR